MVVLFSISAYRQVSNISRTLVGNKIVDHSDVVGASPVVEIGVRQREIATVNHKTTTIPRWQTPNDQWDTPAKWRQRIPCWNKTY